MSRALPCLLLGLLLLTGCSNPRRTIDLLQKQITEFRASPDDAKETAIEKSFVTLDEQIAAVAKKGNTIEARELQRQADDLHGDFQSAKMARAMQDAQKALKGFGEALKSTGKNFQDAFKGTNSEGKE